MGCFEGILDEVPLESIRIGSWVLDGVDEAQADRIAAQKPFWDIVHELGGIDGAQRTHQHRRAGQIHKQLVPAAHTR